MFLVQRVQNVVKNRRVSCQKKPSGANCFYKICLFGFGYVCCSQPTNWHARGKWRMQQSWMVGHGHAGYNLKPTCENTRKGWPKLGHGEQQQDSGQLVHTLQTRFVPWLSSGFTLKLLPWPRYWHFDMIHWWFFVWNSRRQDSCFIQT